VAAESTCCATGAILSQVVNGRRYE